MHIPIRAHLAYDESPYRRKQRAQVFGRIRTAENDYARHLRKLARTIGDFIDQFEPGSVDSSAEIDKLLTEYAKTIQPWARTVARRMVYEVDRRDRAAWRRHAQKVGTALKLELDGAPTGRMLEERLEEQVTLITSLPLEAAQRVHKLTLEGLADGTRAKEIANEILRSGEVTRSRANLIARTEVARTAAGLTHVRAKHIGSDGYIWRTARDADVRESHRRMEGKFVQWSEPPTLIDGTTTHAGEIYNCRCYPEPVLPERFD